VLSSEPFLLNIKSLTTSAIYARIKSKLGIIHINRTPEILFISIPPIAKPNSFMIGNTINVSLINKIIKVIRDAYIDFCQLRSFAIILNRITKNEQYKGVCTEG